MAEVQVGNVSIDVLPIDRIRICQGLAVGVIDEVVTPTGLAAYDLVNLLPVGAVVISATIKPSATVVATTAVKIGIGRKNATADPDKYALSAGLTSAITQGIKIPFILSDAAIGETLQVTACDTSGAAAGTLNSGGTIRAVVVYLVPAILV